MPKDILTELSLFMEFDSLSSRYLLTQNSAFHRVPEEDVADQLMKMLRTESLLEALRLGTQWFMDMLEIARGREWYVADRSRLSRHAVFLALFPEAFSAPGMRPGGPVAGSLLDQRRTISQDYPHLYDPRSWDEVKEEVVGRPSLRQGVKLLEMELRGLDEEKMDEYLKKYAALQVVFMRAREAYPLYMEELLAIQEEIDIAREELSREGTGMRKDVDRLLEKNEPTMFLVLNIFVIESLIFRLMLEEGLTWAENRAGQWISDGKPVDSALRPISSEDAKRSLELMDALYRDPKDSNDRMMDISRTIAHAGDPDSSWNVTAAVLPRCEGTDAWNVVAFQAAVNQMKSSDGRQQELARAIMSNAEKGTDMTLHIIGLMAMALSQHSLGHFDGSKGYHERLMEALLAGQNDPDILRLYPMAAWTCLEMEAKQDARKLASIGLTRMNGAEMDRVREQMLDIRRRADRVKKMKGPMPALPYDRHR